MKRVLFNKSLVLIKVTEGHGHSDRVTETSVNVRGYISLPSLMLKTAAEGAGMRIDLTAQVWKRDFEKDDFTHLEYSGTRYRIGNVTAGLNDLIVKLSLERG